MVDSIIQYSTRQNINENSNIELEITGMAIDTNEFIGINQDGLIYNQYESDENFQGYSPIEDEDEDEDEVENSDADDDYSNVPPLDHDDSGSEGEIIAENNTINTESTTNQEFLVPDDVVDTITDEGYDSY